MSIEDHQESNLEKKDIGLSPECNSSKTNTPAQILFPEGGSSAWATALGAFLIQFCAFGYTTSFGVYQDYYVRVHLANQTASAISWIGSINGFLVVGGGLLAGRIHDRGYFYRLLWGGSCLTSFSLFMLSLTKPNHYYQVLLSQGFGVGIGMGMIYVPSMAVLSHYFQRRRSLVMMLVTSGASLGAVIHPIMLNNTLEKIGFPNATRANAGLVSAFLLTACLAMRTRLPPPATTLDLNMTLVKFSKDKAYICCGLGLFFFLVGVYFPIFYLQLDSIKHNLSQNFAFYSLVILNGSSLFGRLASGFLVGIFGIENLIIIATASCSILIFSMIGVSGVASVVFIALFYGFFSGIFVALMGPMVANLADDFSEVGLRMGVGFTLAGLGGLIGTPIDGALLTAKYHWWRAAVFSGVMALLGCVMYMAMVLHLRQKRLSKKEETRGGP